MNTMTAAVAQILIGAILAIFVLAIVAQEFKAYLSEQRSINQPYHAVYMADLAQRKVIDARITRTIADREIILAQIKEEDARHNAWLKARNQEMITARIR